MMSKNFSFSYSPSENVKWLLINVYLIRWNNIAEKLFLSPSPSARELKTLFNSLRMFYLIIRPSLRKQNKHHNLDNIFHIKEENNILDVKDYAFQDMNEFVKAYGMLLHTASIELGLNIDVKLEIQGLMTDTAPINLNDFEK